jgi:exopolysaccharide production protein ExoZ
MPSADAPASLPAPTLDAAESVPDGVIDGELGHAGSGTVGPVTRGLAGRLAWLRSFVRIQADARAIAALDGMRGLAASLVFIVHYQAAFGRLLAAHPSGAAAGQYAAQVGYHGVNLFFVLSGFLIYGSLVGRPVPLRLYAWRRVRRIYPTFLVVLGLYLTVGRSFLGREKLPSSGTLAYIMENVLLLPGVFPIPPIITVAWSLSYEIFFYLGIAAIVVGLRMRQWRARHRVAFFVALVMAWVVAGQSVQASVGSFIMFVPGILLWELSRTPTAEVLRRRTSPLVVWGGLAAALLVAPAFESRPLAGYLTRTNVTHATAAFLVLALTVPLLLLHALGSRGPVARALGWEPLRQVGVISYSFYLIHGVTINVLALGFWSVMGPQPPRGELFYFLLFPLVFVAAALSALVLFRSVEERISL